MKNILIAGVLSLFFLTACKNEVPSAPAEPPSVPATTVPSVPEKPKPETEGTSVKVGSDGVSVKTDGKTKTDVEVKSGEASVEIK